jgi:hypothetical protein
VNATDFEAFKKAKAVHGAMLELPKTFGELSEGEYFRHPKGSWFVDSVFVKRRGAPLITGGLIPTAVYVSGPDAGRPCWIEDTREVEPLDLSFSDS